MDEVRCRICCYVLRQDRLLAGDANRKIFSTGNEAALEYDGTGHFFRCPRCSAKNIVKTTSVNGQPRVEVIRAEMAEA